MAIDVYLKSFLGGVPGGGDAAGALGLFATFGATRDEFGAWQIELSDGVAAEVTDLQDLSEAEPGDFMSLSCLVRLSELTPRGADFLFGLAQSGLMAVIYPYEDAPLGAYVLVPMEVDPADLPDDALFDAAEGIESSNELYAALEPLQLGRWMVDEGALTPRHLPHDGFWARIKDWIAGR